MPLKQERNLEETETHNDLQKLSKVLEGENLSDLETKQSEDGTLYFQKNETDYKVLLQEEILVEEIESLPTNLSDVQGFVGTGGD